MDPNNNMSGAQQQPPQNTQYNYNANYNQWQQYNQYPQYPQYNQYNQYNPYNNYQQNPYNNAQNMPPMNNQYNPYNNYQQNQYNNNNNIPPQQQQQPQQQPMQPMPNYPQNPYNNNVAQYQQQQQQWQQPSPQQHTQQAYNQNPNASPVQIQNNKSAKSAASFKKIEDSSDEEEDTDSSDDDWEKQKQSHVNNAMMNSSVNHSVKESQTNIQPINYFKPQNGNANPAPFQNNKNNSQKTAAAMNYFKALNNANSNPMQYGNNNSQNQNKLEQYAPAVNNNKRKSNGAQYGNNNNHIQKLAQIMNQGMKKKVWVCAACTLENPINNQKCDVCGHLKPVQQQPINNLNNNMQKMSFKGHKKKISHEDLKHLKKINNLNFNYMEQFDQSQLNKFKNDNIAEEDDEPAVAQVISPVLMVKKGDDVGKYKDISEMELSKKMDAMMQAMNIPETAKIPMLKMGRQQKIQMVMQWENQSQAKSPKIKAKIQGLKTKAKNFANEFNEKYGQERVAGMDDFELSNNKVEDEPEGKYIDIQMLSAGKMHVYDKYDNISEEKLSKKMESMMKVMNMNEAAKDRMRNLSRQQKIQMIMQFEQQFYAKEKAEREKVEKKKSLKHKIPARISAIRKKSLKFGDHTPPTSPMSPNSKKKKKLFKLFGPKGDD